MAARWLVRYPHPCPTTPIIAITAAYRSHTPERVFGFQDKRQTRPIRAAPQHPFSKSTFSTTTNSNSSEMSNFYDLKADKPNGTSFNFSELKGKVVLVVNVASQWSRLHETVYRTASAVR
ncbi:hypothetical protein JB92DRAFT_2207006 [Gautieria morchelliformis]|nr:hypothetical protein JB92DRAFT_2207006 [Gautieria morchelliformis]